MFGRAALVCCGGRSTANDVLCKYVSIYARRRLTTPTHQDWPMPTVPLGMRRSSNMFMGSNVQYRYKTARAFVDRARLLLKAGSGGQGSKSSGLGGGDGGNITAVVDAGLSDLSHLTKGPNKISAPSGGNATRSGEGEAGEDLFLYVPRGTVVTTEAGHHLTDLDTPGQKAILAYGGEGGSALTNETHSGLKGDAIRVNLELKSIADVGLVGFPNAGKSSLLSAISNIKPKVADYPFTTLQPHVGTVQFEDMFTARVADIPGLIEGASQNQGMGHSFLRHIERTSVLLYVVDINGFQLSQDSPHLSAKKAFELLCKELELYQPGLVKRPSLLVVNKLDVRGSRAAYDQFRNELRELLKEQAMPELQTVLPISVQDRYGIKELKIVLRDVLEKERQKKKDTIREKFVERLFTLE
eukprot:m.937051 g.937051  ORF g.937051 m.937051 type:complete len:413 (-) comp23813_c1_seq2:311-1549(-)